MSRKSLVSAFGGFATHYGEEIGMAATALSMIVDHLPVQAQDKQNIKGSIAGIAGAAGNIAKSLDGASFVGVTNEDVSRAVAAFMDDNDRFTKAVDAAVSAHLANVTDATIADRVDAFLRDREIGNRPGKGPNLAEADAHDTQVERDPATTRELVEGDKPGATSGDKSAKPGSKAATGQRAGDKAAG